MEPGNICLGYRFVRHTRRAILTQALAWVLTPALSASASAWTVLGVQDTALQGISVAAVSANGEIYSAAFEASALGPCPAPTLTVGDTSRFSSCVTKTNASGHQVFSIQIGGADVKALTFDAAGNAYIAGSTGSVGAPVFVTTPGAYKSSPPSEIDAFTCKLSNTDGSPLFCTFVDVLVMPNSNGGLSSTSGFIVDSAGNTYLAGLCGNFQYICVEELNPTGTALVYRSNLNTRSTPSPNWYPAYAAVDAHGDLCVAHANVGIVTLNSSGAVIGMVTNLGSDLPVALAFDPAGNPQVLLQDLTNSGNLRMRRYIANLTQIVFETKFFVGSSPTIAGMGIDAAGVAYVWGGTPGVDLSPVHPTEVCYPPPPTFTSSAFLARFGDSGDVLQATYLHIPPNFVAGGRILFHSGGASVLYYGIDLANNATLELLQVGPSASGIALSCIGGGASFANMPLAPNEVVSLFGDGIGPSQPVSAQPDASGIFPFELGGTQVNFDGVPTPLLYAASGQINLVTPRSLQGKTTTHVCAVVNHVPTNCIDMPVQLAAPGVFTSGTWFGGVTPYAAAVNQDGTINSAQNPAPAGSVVSLFVTGLGTMTPSPPDGAVTPSPPPAQDLKASVTFRWNRTPSSDFELFPQVLYAGPAPLELEGVGQINAVVPAAPPAGLVTAGPFVHVEVALPSGGHLFSPEVILWTK